jgi:hypothetical protein
MDYMAAITTKNPGMETGASNSHTTVRDLSYQMLGYLTRGPH